MTTTFPPRTVKALHAAGIDTHEQLAAHPEIIATLDIPRTDKARLRAGIASQRVTYTIPTETVRTETPPVIYNSAPAGDVLPAGTPALLTTTEAADILRLTRKTVINWIISGKIRARKLGDDYRIPRAELEQLLATPTP